MPSSKPPKKDKPVNKPGDARYEKASESTTVTSLNKYRVYSISEFNVTFHTFLGEKLPSQAWTLSTKTRFYLIHASRKTVGKSGTKTYTYRHHPHPTDLSPQGRK